MRDNNSWIPNKNQERIQQELCIEIGSDHRQKQALQTSSRDHHSQAMGLSSTKEYSDEHNNP